MNKFSSGLKNGNSNPQSDAQTTELRGVIGKYV